MALISLPNIGWLSCEFDPIYPVNTDQMEGRRSEQQTFGTPYWVAKFTTRPLTLLQFGLVEAFIMDATAPGNLILAGDVSRPRPVLMDNKVPLLDGNGTLTSIVSARQQIISNVQVGLHLWPGDYVEYRMPTGSRSMHRIMAEATANSEGVVVVTVQYPLDTQNFTTAATAHFESPACVMSIDTGSYSATKQLLDRAASFSATEMFLT